MNNRRMDQQQTERLFMHGIVGGIIAGVVFILAEMVINLAMGKPFLGPLRLISTIVLGAQAIGPAYSLATALIVGVIVHFILAAIFGVIFLGLLAIARQLSVPTGILLLYSSVFGLLLWVVNFLIIAPVVFPQFTQVNQFWNGFIAHTFFYGTILGMYVETIRETSAAVEM